VFSTVALLTDAPVTAFVATANLDRSHAFYGGVLGLRRVEATTFANVYAGAGTLLRVTAVRSVADTQYTVAGWDVPDMDAAVDALTARGVHFKRFDAFDQDHAGAWTAPGGSRIAWFDDPDGNTLSLHQAPASNGRD
jgi:catechol 2,3-dioxygenase-like lactoylglutathione lyase family enzyme